MRRKETPKVTETNSLHEDRKYTHPAFAQISAHRITGRTHLYDSDFAHDGFIRIRVERSEQVRTLAHDFHFPKETLIEVDLSYYQWARFVSTQNTSGTPCTLRRTETDWDIPEILPITEEEQIKKDFKKKTAELEKELTEIRAKIEGEIGTSLSKKKKDAVLGHLLSIERAIADSMPYIAKSFDNHVEHSVTKAQIEVEAYVNSTIQRAGLKALHEQNNLLLSSSDEDS